MLLLLFQVLHDFQKNQAREISEATERTRRQLEEEQARVTSVTSQFNALKVWFGVTVGISLAFIQFAWVQSFLLIYFFFELTEFFFEENR